VQSDGTGYKREGDGFHAGDGSQVNLSSDTSSWKLLRGTRQGEQNVAKLRDFFLESFGKTGCTTVCVRSVWEE
jgi:hypothetical protein